MNDRPERSGRGALCGSVVAVFAALCCLAGPAILGAVAGAAIGGALGIGAVALCAAGAAALVVVLLRGRRARRSAGC